MANNGYRVPPKSQVQIIREAAKLRRDFGIDKEPYFDIVRFIECVLPILYADFSFKVEDDEKLPHEHALTFPDTKRMYVRESVYLDAVNGIGRARFTLAHELAHLINHAGIRTAYARSKGPEELKPFENSEWQANSYASHYLAPLHLITPDMSIYEISDRFGVSLKVAEIQRSRLYQYGQIPPTEPSGRLVRPGQRIGR